MQSLSGTGCSTTLPTAWNRTDHTYQHGVLATSQDLGVPLRSVDRTIDRFTLRDLDGKVLRTWEATGYVWSWSEDHVYRGSTLLASVTPAGTTHLHTDHLGTVRATTNASGTRTGYHLYYPFGEEATSIAQDTQRMKFTGHERDLGVTISPADDLDSMHARFFNPQTGRFLSVDPGRDFDQALPQSWNRYSYVRNNPLGNVDPDGRVLDTVLDVAFMGYDLFDIGRSLVRGEGVSGTQLAALGADVAGIFVPFGTGGGIAVRALGKVDNLQDIGKLSKVATGLSSKSTVREAVTRLGLPTAQETAIN